MKWMSRVKESRNDEDMKKWWFLGEIQRLDLKRSANYVEEGKLMTSEMNSNFNFDLKNASRMSKLARGAIFAKFWDV